MDVSIDKSDAATSAFLITLSETEPVFLNR
jgi:hypothetical protein